jgi:hypothetical protein
MVVTDLPGVGRPQWRVVFPCLYFVDKSFYPRKEKMRSAGFEPAGVEFWAQMVADTSNGH